MDEADWLAAIRDNPDDDTPRLVFADWLHDHGEPQRAEFIRAQIALARGEKNSALAKRAASQQRSLAPGWLAPLRAALDRPRRRALERAEFRRGFLEQINLTPRLPGLLAAAGPELARHPIQRLALGGLRSGLSLPDVLSELADCPHFGGLQSLFASGYLGASPESVRRFASSPHYPRLAHLDLWITLIPAEVRALAESPLAARLLSLTVGRIAEPADAREVVRLIAGTPRFTALRRLSLMNCELWAEGVGLLTGPHLPALAELQLFNQQLTPTAVGRLLDSPRVATLTELDLTHCKVARQVVRSLAGRFAGLALRRLCLDYGGLDGDGVRLLADAPSWGALTELSLRGSLCGDAAMARLAASPHLAQLTHLVMLSCGSGAATFKALLARADLGGLQELRLYESKMPDVTRRQLRKHVGAAFRFDP